ELDPMTLQRLQDHLQLLSVGVRQRTGEPPAKSLLDSAAARQQDLARQVSSELARQEAEARKLQEQSPREALEILKAARATVVESELEPVTRNQLLRRVDLRIGDMEQFIEDNLAQITLDETNREIRGEVDKRRWDKVEL